MPSPNGYHPPVDATPADMFAPNNVEAEQAVIGSVLINPDCLYELLPFLRAEDFFIVRHSWVWEAFVRLHERRDPIDYLTVVSEIERFGQLAEIGGAAYILSLINATPSALNAEGYGRIVEDAALSRRLIDAGGQIARVAHSTDSSADKVAAAEAALFDVRRPVTRNTSASLGSVLSAVYDSTESALRDGVAPGIRTGWADLDSFVSFQPQTFWLFGGRPGMGKSGLLGNIALHNAKQGIPVGFLSLEMSKEEIARRFAVGETGIPYDRILNGEMDTPQFSAFGAAVGQLSELPFHLDDEGAITPSQLRSKMRAMIAEFGVEVFFLDYIQLMRPDSPTGNPVADVTQISQSVKALAKEFDRPIVAAAQLSRAVEQRADKRPVLSDLRESGSLEQDADGVGFIYREGYYNPDAENAAVTEVHIAKHRNGKTGTVNLIFEAERMQFHNAVKRHIELD